MILPATRTWRNRFVALSAPSTRLRLLRNHSPNFLSDVFKCDLQNTQTAPLAAVCTPTIKLVQQNHQKTRNLVKNVCVKLALCFFLSLFSLSHSPSDSVFYPSFPASGHNRILLCFSGMCQNPVMLFRESVPSESAMGSVRVCACLRLAAPVCTFSGTECSFIWTAPLPDGDTWRPATHI